MKNKSRKYFINKFNLIGEKINKIQSDRMNSQTDDPDYWDELESIPRLEFTTIMQEFKLWILSKYKIANYPDIEEVFNKILLLSHEQYRNEFKKNEEKYMVDFYIKNVKKFANSLK